MATRFSQRGCQGYQADSMMGVMPENRPSSMPTAGAIGRNLLASLDELAAARGYSMRRLSTLLDDIGRPIPPLGLARILKGDRRVDVDEATALALALGVNVSALLLPRHVAADDVVELTPEVRQRASVTWGWADGRFPMPAGLVPEGTREVATSGEKFADFQKHARPDTQPADPDPAVAELMTLARMLELVLADPARTQAWTQFRDMALRRFRLAAIQLEGLVERLDRDALAESGFAFDSGAAVEQLRVTSSGVREAAVGFAPGTVERYAEQARQHRAGPHGAATSRVTDPFGERGA